VELPFSCSKPELQIYFINEIAKRIKDPKSNLSKIQPLEFLLAIIVLPYAKPEE